MTYSIVGRDPATGRLGLAVQSHVPAAGHVVDHVRAGIGAVASQADSLYAHGTRTLDGIAGGASAADALAGSLDLDDDAEIRQVTVVSVDGPPAAHTGDACLRFAGHAVGDHWVVAGNILADAGVVDAMASTATTAWSDPAPTLPQRLLEVLEAAEAAGGDARGRQSASMVVVRGTDTGEPTRDHVVNVRVDDHPEPVGELARLVALAETASHFSDVVERLASDPSDDTVAAVHATLDALAPMRDTAEYPVWAAVALAAHGRHDDAATAIARLHDDPQRAAMEELSRRLAEVGRVDATTVDGWWA